LSSSKNHLDAFAIGPAGAAMRLREKIQRIAGAFNSDIHPIDAISSWREVTYALLEFEMDMEEMKGTAAKTKRMLIDLANLLHDLLSGRPSIADNFRKARGQRSSSAVDFYIVQFCVAITWLVKSGCSVEEAAKQVTKIVKKAGLKMPPMRSMERAEWRSLEKRREKLISYERDELEARAYHTAIAACQDMSPEQCRAKALARLNAIAGIYGKNP
jgi:hypothetical protein